MNDNTFRRWQKVFVRREAKMKRSKKQVERTSEEKRNFIKVELEKLKKWKAKYGKKLTGTTLKAMRGFENLTDELADEIVEQLEEYASIILKQLNRLNAIKNRTYGQKGIG